MQGSDSIANGWVWILRDNRPSLITCVMSFPECLVLWLSCSVECNITKILVISQQINL